MLPSFLISVKIDLTSYLIEHSGIKMKVSSELAAAAVRTLIVSFADRDHIGPLYHQVMELYVRSVCEQIVL